MGLENEEGKDKGASPRCQTESKYASFPNRSRGKRDKRHLEKNQQNNKYVRNAQEWFVIVSILPSSFQRPSLMTCWHIFLSLATHLKHHQPGRRALLEIDGTQGSLIHASGCLIMGHEHESAQVWPSIDELFEGTHHPRRETTALELFHYEDIGEISECDVVSDDSRQADHSEVWSAHVARHAIVF